MTAFERIAAEAERLGRHEQLLLAERIYLKLGASPEHDEAWLRECERRVAASERGEMNSEPAEDVFQKARRILGT
jgi:hypothetical protein